MRQGLHKAPAAQALGITLTNTVGLVAPIEFQQVLLGRAKRSHQIERSHSGIVRGVRAAQRFSSAEHGLKLGGVFVDLLQALNQLFCGLGSNGSASFGDRIGVGALLAVRLAHQNQGQACAQALGSGQAA